MAEISLLDQALDVIAAVELPDGEWAKVFARASVIRGARISSAKDSAAVEDQS